MNEINGFFDDDGNELKPEHFPKPRLCMSCKKNDDDLENILCALTRLDQRNQKEFDCAAYLSL